MGGQRQDALRVASGVPIRAIRIGRHCYQKPNPDIVERRFFETTLMGREFRILENVLSQMQGSSDHATATLQAQGVL